MKDDPETDPSIKSGAVETLKEVNFGLDGDLEGILRDPDPELRELAVLNPSVYQGNNEGPWEIVWRTETPTEKGRTSVIDYGLLETPTEKGRTSVIDYGLLETPTKLSKDKRTIIKPEYPWESKGCEDPRLTKIRNKYFITYVAFDGINVRVALASTEDLENKKPKKHGIISCQVPLNEAAGIVNNEIFKKRWENDFIKEFNNLEDKTIPLYIGDKDAILDYDYKNNEWVYMHRWDPYMLVAKVKKIRHLQDKNWWKDYIKNVDSHIALKINEPWASSKTGWGSTLFNIGDKRIILIHGVDEKLNYCGTFCELDDSYKIVSLLKDPLLEPGDDDLFEYVENGSKKNKKVIFPTGALVQGNRLFVYSGSADKKIKYRTTNIHWLYSELNHPENRIEGIKEELIKMA